MTWVSLIDSSRGQYARVARSSRGAEGTERACRVVGHESAGLVNHVRF